MFALKRRLFIYEQRISTVNFGPSIRPYIVGRWSAGPHPTDTLVHINYVCIMYLNKNDEMQYSRVQSFENHYVGQYSLVSLHRYSPSQR